MIARPVLPESGAQRLPAQTNQKSSALDVESFDLSPAAREDGAALGALAAVVLQLGELESHLAFARADDEVLLGRHDGDRGEIFLAALDLLRREAEDLVALAARQFGQILHREYEQLAVRAHGAQQRLLGRRYR